MDDSTLLLAIEAMLGEIASTLGAEWPAFRARMREVLEELASTPDLERARACMDKLLALGLKSRARPLFQGLMARAMPSGSSWSTRNGSAPPPVPLEARPSLEVLRQRGVTLSRALAHEPLESVSFLPSMPPAVPPVLTQGTPLRSASSPQAEPVDCAVFAPPACAPGSSLLVQVFFYSPEHEAQARQQALENDADAQRRGVVTLDLDIPRGTRLWIRLELPGWAIDQAETSVVWRGRPCVAQFAVSVPVDQAPKTVIGKVSVALDGVPMGSLRFKLEVAPGASAEPSAVGCVAQRFRKAFISYSNQDRAEVLKRVQMLRANRVEFFQDFLDMEPGERWERRLHQEIDTCDVFYLFWSSASKGSEWVRRELDYVLRRKQGNEEAPPEIIPIPIEGPPIPAPPDNLRHLQFNDSLLDHIKVAGPS